jgi:hypothetical protein
MRLLTFALLATLVAACDDEPTNPPPDDGYYINLTYSPPAVNIPLGGNEVINIQVTRGGLYPGAITLTTSTLPTGLIPTFNPPILSGTADRATLTLTAGPGTVAGTCPFTITASGQGVDTKVTPTISCAVTGQ